MSTAADAQDKWEAVYNKKIVHKGGVDKGDVITLRAVPSFKTTDILSLRYHTENSDNTWKRTFYINGANDNVLKTIEMNGQSGTVRIKNSILKELAAKKQPLTVYTSSVPKDPAKASSVRVRRMMLCKIEWQ